MKLYDKTCKTAEPRLRPYKLFDGQGLYLEVTPKGRKFWRMKYHYIGTEKRISLGQYPTVTLAEAREKCFEALKLLDQDIDPSAERQERHQAILIEKATTFKVVALEWYERNRERWSEGYAKEVLTLLEKDVFPLIGDMGIQTIELHVLVEKLRTIERRGALEQLRKVCTLCGQVFRYGMQTGKCTQNITPNLKGAFKTRKTKHYAAITPQEIPELLKAVEKNKGSILARNRLALQLSLLTFQRPGEIRQMKRTEIDWENFQWIIPAERMKLRRAHIVPLSRQAVAIIREQLEATKRLKTEWVFPCSVRPRNQMQENAVRETVQGLGFKGRMTAHGFRALARTTIRECLDYEPDVIEVQLAHKAAGPLGEAYNRAQFIHQRVEMMQAWADYLDRVATTGKVVVEKRDASMDNGSRHQEATAYYRVQNYTDRAWTEGSLRRTRRSDGWQGDISDKAPTNGDALRGNSRMRQPGHPVSFTIATGGVSYVAMLELRG